MTSWWRGEGYDPRDDFGANEDTLELLDRLNNYEEQEDEENYDIGTCQGCGAYGVLGKMHTRNGEECGEYL